MGMSTTLTPIPPESFRPLITWLGMYISGDVGGYTVYTTRRGKIVWYPASPALKPPSPLQQKQRLRFKLAQANWRLLSPALVATWEHLTKVLCLPLTGQNLFISLSLRPNNDALTSATRKAGVVLSPPTPVPN